MTVPFVARGTQAWAGFAVSDNPLVHKDPQDFIVQKSFGLKQDVKWNPIPVLTPGMQEPINYRYEGMHSVAGNVQTPLYPEQSLALLESCFGNVVSGTMSGTLVVTHSASATSLDLTINKKTGSEAMIEIFGFADIVHDTEALYTAINGAVGSVVTATYVDAGDHSLGLILTGSELFTVSIYSPSPSQENATFTPSEGYTHQFLGQDTVPNVPLCFTLYEDISCMNLVGCYPTNFDIEIDKGNPVQITYGFVGMHGFDQKGTAGVCVGENSIGGNLPVVIVLNISDQIKLAIDGGTATEITIAAGSYATVDALAAAINTAIENTSALLDTYRRPMVVCIADPTKRVAFYSGSKGTSSSVAWTAGTNDASGLLGNSQAGVAGSATNVKPSESTIQPFITTKARLFLGGPSGVEIPGVEKMKISVNNGMGLLETIGFYFAHIPVIHKRREIKVTIDLAYTDTSILAKFLANTTIALYALLETGVAIGSTSDKYQAEIFLNSCKILKTPLPAVSGQDYIKQTIEAQAFADNTYQDIEIIVKNSRAGMLPA